jgi:hypothetical protein
MQRHILYLKEAASPRLLLVDGMGRSGKFLAAKLISHFSKVEYFIYHPAIEHIPYLQYLDILTEPAAKAFLRMQIDIALTDRIAGRTFNLREEDASSLLHAPDFDMYKERMNHPDIASAVAAFNSEKRSPFFITHEILPHISLFFAITEDLKVVETVRHPVDMAFSWFNRGWGERFGHDPLAFVPTIEHDGHPVPWFAEAFAVDYIKSTPIDRVLMFVLELIKLCERGLSSISDEQRSCIHMLPYEYVLMNPDGEIDKLTDFLGVQPLKTLEGLIVSENLRGKSTIATTQEKLKHMQERAAPRLVSQLIEAGRKYERLYGLDPVTPQ